VDEAVRVFGTSRVEVTRWSDFGTMSLNTHLVLFKHARNRKGPPRPNDACFLLRCGACMHELEDMFADIIVWPDGAAAELRLASIRKHTGASRRCVSLLMLATKV
jgi:hypothetical protein